MGEFKVEGANQLANLAKALKQTGQKDLRRDLSRALNRSTSKAKTAARASARSTLPKRGGLAERVARSRFTTSVRSTGKFPSVQFVAKGSSNIAAMDYGRVRHPVYGTDTWVQQRVFPGWWRRPMKANADDTRKNIAAALADVEKRFSSRRF